MAEANRSWSDRKIETIIGNLLRIGVIVSAAVVLAGGMIYLARHGAEQPAYEAFRGEPERLRSVPGIVKAAISLQGRGLIQLGLLLLILTPVARVAFAVIGFAIERDRMYVMVALIVLSLLCFSLTGG